MADIFGNPYLPDFVRNQPNMSAPVLNTPAPTIAKKANQITSVQGFSGAHQHAATLTPGSSEIVAEADQNLARVYITVVDQNGQQYVQGFNLVPVEEPKPITMDDLNNKMNLVLNRLDQLEQERVTKNDQSSFHASEQSKPSGGSSGSGSRGSQNSPRSYGRAVPNGGNESSDERGN